MRERGSVKGERRCINLDNPHYPMSYGGRASRGSSNAGKLHVAVHCQKSVQCQKIEYAPSITKLSPE